MIYKVLIRVIGIDFNSKLLEPIEKYVETSGDEGVEIVVSKHIKGVFRIIKKDKFNGYAKEIWR